MYIWCMENVFSKFFIKDTIEINWEYVMTIPEFQRMEGCKQPERWHMEGDVMNHTKLCLEWAYDALPYYALPFSHQRTLLMGVLFHDIGKPDTTEFKKGDWHSYGHDCVGEKIARRILWDEPMEYREQVCALIRYHMDAYYLISKGNPIERIVDMSFKVSLFDLMFVHRSDIMGSKTLSDEDTTRPLKEVTVIEEISQVFDCYEHPFCLSFDEYKKKGCYGRRLFYHNKLPQVMLPEQEVVIMVGLPGSGKDTHIKRYLPNHVVLSRDEIRVELGYCTEEEKIAGSREQEKNVTKIFNERLLKAIEEGKNVVINNTNLRKKSRDEFKALLKGKNVQWKIIYLESPSLEETLKRREGQIEKEVFNRMINNLEWMLPSEYDTLITVKQEFNDKNEIVEKTIFSKSEKFKEEYSVGVVRITTLNPIEGSDFLVQAMVNGFSIVVRKDEVKEGDILFYVMNESQLNADFLSKNDLFELSEAERNSNWKYVSSLLEEGKTDEAKKQVGFFNKHGRVKMIRLRGCPSMGFLFDLSSLIKWKPSLKGVNLEDYVGEYFDTIDGELFVKAYVPYIPPQRQSASKGEKRNKKIARFNRMIPGQFAFHYDTNQLNNNIWRITPDTDVTISVKIHGTSAIYANVLVKKPCTITYAQKVVRKAIDLKIRNLTKQLKRTRFGTKKAKLIREIEYFKKIRKEDYAIGYGNVYSSRTVIMSQYINQKVTKGYYETDVWSEYNRLLKPFIPQGMIIYGEIFGYTNGEKMVQKNYDYGCKVGENKLMIYRIVMNKEDGSKLELDVADVRKWTETFLKKNPELKDKILPIDILYNGKLSDLYPEIDRENHWNENVLEAMKKDKEHFGMEEREPLCKNKVYREGIVLRINNDPIAEAFKLKCDKFREYEGKLMDAGEVDIEMENVDY